MATPTPHRRTPTVAPTLVPTSAPFPAAPPDAAVCADHAALAAYVSEAARGLQLCDWALEVVLGDAGEDACAKVDALYGQRRATITFGPQFATQSPTDQRDTVVHELLHLVLMPSWQYIDELLDAELGVRAARVAWLAYTQHVEYAVDQLAAIIAPSVALPPAFVWDAATFHPAPSATQAPAAQAPEIQAPGPESAGSIRKIAGAGRPGSDSPSSGRTARRRTRTHRT
jgi:hypothetical protein